jgi:hypothetical protein
MLASTKTGTIVELLSGRQSTAAEVGTAIEALERRSFGGLVSVVLRYQPSQLVAQKRRDGALATGSQNPCLVDELIVDR